MATQHPNLVGAEIQITEGFPLEILGSLISCEYIERREMITVPYTEFHVLLPHLSAYRWADTHQSQNTAGETSGKIVATIFCIWE